MKNGCTNKLKQSASEINAALLGYYTELQEIFKRFEVAEIMPSPAEVKEAFNNRHGQNEKTELASADTSNVPSNFYEAFDDFVRVCGRQNDWTHSTFEKFAAVKNHLKNFRSELSFEFFDEEGLTEYVQYLREVREMRNSTIGKQLSFLKWFLRWSFKQGLHSNNAYDTFKPKLKDTQKKIIFLTWEEYKDVEFENDKALPVITNQKMNDYLKELAELAEINEPVRQTYYKGNERIDEVTPKYALLGTHAGRRTFICNALALGIPPQVVMKWTGHSDYKAMKPYIDIADDIKANAMSKFNQL